MTEEGSGDSWNGKAPRKCARVSARKDAVWGQPPSAVARAQLESLCLCLVNHVEERPFQGRVRPLKSARALALRVGLSMHAIPLVVPSPPLVILTLRRLAPKSLP